MSHFATLSVPLHLGRMGPAAPVLGTATGNVNGDPLFLELTVNGIFMRVGGDHFAISLKELGGIAATAIEERRKRL